MIAHIYATTHGLGLSRTLPTSTCNGNATVPHHLSTQNSGTTLRCPKRMPRTWRTVELRKQVMEVRGRRRRTQPLVPGLFMSLTCSVCRVLGTASASLTTVSERETRTIRPLPGISNPNVTLARYGLQGSAPITPSVAITFRTLRCFRQCHRVCPRLSRQAFVRSLCHLHEVSYHPYLVDQFTIAYDVFLDIMYRVKARCDEVLGRDTQDWRMKNSCPPCTYKLEGEPSLRFNLICSLDRNSSLKLVGEDVRSGNFRLDERAGRTELFLSQAEVDALERSGVSAKSHSRSLQCQWSDCSQPDQPGESEPDHQPMSVAADASPREDSDALNAGDDDRGAGEAGWVDIPNEANEQADCAERWRAAGPESRKKMFALFDASEIFVAVCRHGHVLVLCDIVKSGEL